jgi:hypothetical protein
MSLESTKKRQKKGYWEVMKKGVVGECMVIAHGGI